MNEPTPPYSTAVQPCPGLNRGPAAADICVNLWYFLDAQTGLVFLLAGRAYAIAGPPAEQRRLLAALACADFHLAPAFSVPGRLALAPPGWETEEGLLQPEMIDLFHAQVFAPVYQWLRQRLPRELTGAHGSRPGQRLRIPEDVVCLTTCVVEYEDGRLEPLPLPLAGLEVG